MTYGLTDKEIESINTVFQGYPAIEQVTVFGSRALETQRHNSDIDLALHGEIGDSVLRDVREDLEALPLPYMFDVVIYNDITHPPFKEHIDTYEQLFYESNK